MSNSKRGAVKFKSGGRQRNMRLSTNAMVRYQDMFGETIFDAFQALEDSPGDFRRVRGFFFVGVDGGEDWDLEAAGDMIDDLGLTRATDVISEAVIAAFPDAAEVGSEGEAQTSGNGKAKTKAATT